MRPAARGVLRLRDSPYFLFPTVFLAQVLCWMVVHFEDASWHEDGGPELAVTSDWKPNQRYAPEIEAAIRALSVSDPGKVQFLRERGIPIHVLTPAQMAVSGCPPRSLGCTRKANSSINLLDIAGNYPDAAASVLSHELTHAAFHDARSSKAERSLPLRVLWRNEESEAHVAELATARRLHVPMWSGALAGWPLEYLVWYCPSGSFLITASFSILGLSRIWLHSARVARGRRERRVAEI